MTLGRSSSGAIKIKTDSPKGLRAVECGCCNTTPPSGCCLYPAQALIDGLYTVEDLPGELSVYSPENGAFVTVEKTGGIFPAYIYPADPTITISITEYDGVLQWHGPGGLPYGDCLISESFVLDKFADTYTVYSPSGFLPGNTILTRTGVCTWSKVWDDPNEYGYCPTSEYEFLPDGNVNLISEGPPYGRVTLLNNFGKWQVLSDRTYCGGYSDFGIKFPESSSPVGEYRFFEDLTFIIS